MAKAKAKTKAKAKSTKTKATTKKASTPKANKRAVVRPATKAKPKKAVHPKVAPKKSAVSKKSKPVAAKKKPEAPKPKSKGTKPAAQPAVANSLAPRPIQLKPPAPSKPVQKSALLQQLPKPAASRAKILSREFLFDVAKAIRVAVEPLVRSVKGREVVGSATSGDATFQLDKAAEKALLTFLRDAKLPVAYYSEDAGYTTFTTGQPQHLLIVDPIDGSRAAKSGFESCVVSVASTRVIERPRIGDVDNACVMEIIGPRTFYAERGKGTRIYEDNVPKKPKLSKNANLELVSWSMTVPARPAELIFPTAAKLIDLTSLKGGFFACNSTSYSLTRLLTGQYDACIDIANRFLRDIPEIVEDHFINAGRGIVLGIAPYDIAASILIAQEAGCLVTDAYGANFDEVLLLDSSVANFRSLVAAANKELYDKLFSYFETRIQQYEQLLKRRAALAAGARPHPAR
ncbi:MAG: hypothetical protein K1Y02_16285 [Candidatus Hydrogenedentes bacterium]|nr:hypothetical protein [Candidatus Hydrogenedentota bacterium]